MIRNNSTRMISSSGIARRFHDPIQPCKIGSVRAARHTPLRRMGPLVSRFIPPFVQMSQVCDLLGTCGLQVQRKPEAVKVCPDIIVVGVALFKPQSGTKLSFRVFAARRGWLPSKSASTPCKDLDRNLESGLDAGRSLVKSRRGRSGLAEPKRRRHAVCLHFVQTGRAVILPIGQGRGGHGEPPLRTITKPVGATRRE